MADRSLVSTHVLDASGGVPAQGMSVTLTAEGGVAVASGTTDAEGRIVDLGPPTLESGHYRLTFATGSYFRSRGHATFYPVVDITFEVVAGDDHYHVPILLSPFAFTTYRGS